MRMVEYGNTDFRHKSRFLSEHVFEFFRGTFLISHVGICWYQKHVLLTGKWGGGSRPGRNVQLRMQVFLTCSLSIEI